MIWVINEFRFLFLPILEFYRYCHKNAGGLKVFKSKPVYLQINYGVAKILRYGQGERVIVHINVASNENSIHSSMDFNGLSQFYFSL